MDLSPPVLEGEGLAEALAWLRSQMKELHGLEVDIEVGQECLPTLDEDMRVLIFQAVRELLFNVVKHAGVARAVVALGEENGDVIVRVTDDAFGLSKLRERLGFFGGRVDIDAAAGEGTRVTLRMPAGQST